MADLGLNSLWSDLSSGASNVETDIMGPSYSYADNVPKPSGPGGLGVGTDGSFSQLGTNLGAVGTYVNTLVGTREMGNQYFVNTGGTCTATDGSIQARFNYISNKQAGLVEGVLGDIGGLNPVYLMNSMTASASPACKCYQCEVTSGDAANWLSPDLSPDFDPAKCTVVDSSRCPRVKSTESFTNDTFVPTIIAWVSLGALLFLRTK
jgi:hypothetical protein